MRHGLGKPGSGYPRGRLSYVLLQRGMAVNVSFSIAPQGLEEVFQEMVKAIPEKPFEEFTSTWGTVCRCLDSTGAWACAEGRAADRKVLTRLSTLLRYGQWGATPLDVPPHPKIQGFCLIPASYEENTNIWLEQLTWNQMYLSDDLHRAGKWLNILAWHFSRRENRTREFLWCRRCAWLLREARRSLRAAKVVTEASL